MKILLVSNTIWSIYNFRLGLMKALKQKGFEVAVVAPNEGDKYRSLIEKEGFKVIKLENMDRKSINPFKDLALMFELVGIYKNEKPDLVMHFTVKPNVYGSFAARIAGVKRAISVITGLGYLFISGGLILRTVRNFLYKTALSFVSTVIFQNDSDMEEFIKKKLVGQNKSLVIKGSGVDANYFSPKICDSVKKAGGGFIFLMISRFIADKGVGEYIEAAKRIKALRPEVKLRLLGAIDKDNPASISQEKIDEAKNWVEFYGVTDDVRAFICEADAIVLPSYREGTPRVLLEAMAMEKPIITTDVPGCRELVGENGFLVEPKNVEDLKRAMVKMLESGEAGRKSMGRKGREIILAGLDEKNVIEQYLEAIENLRG